MMARQVNERQDGAVAIIVAISFTVLVIFTAIALELGGAYELKRDLTPDSDAAALAAASSLASQPYGWCSSNLGSASVLANNAADDLLEGNGYDTANEYTVDLQCPDGYRGKVAVSLREDAMQSFGPAVGFDAIEVPSTSIAAFGPSSSAEGLLPFGICDQSPHITEWLSYVEGTLSQADWDTHLAEDEHPEYEDPDGPITVHTLVYDKEGDACSDGKVSGNWGMLGFHGKAGSGGSSCPQSISEKLVSYVCNGYHYRVDLGSTTVTDTTDPGQQCGKESSGGPDDALCAGSPGLRNSLLMALRDSPFYCGNQAGGMFTTRTEDCPRGLILAYSKSYKDGGDALYEPSGFLGIVIRDVQKSGSDYRFDVEFVSHTTSGTIDPSATGPTGVTAVELCGVDGDDGDGDGVIDYCPF